MIDNIKNKAKNLLENGDVQIVIGYAEGPDDSIIAHFAFKAEDVEKFIFNEACVQNLSVYLVKSEIKKIGKACIIAHVPAMRSILQIASENQIKEDNLIVLGISSDNKLLEFKGFKDIETYIATANFDFSEEDKNLLKKLDEKTAEERRVYWNSQFSKCIKCYACRAACPKCYCTRCQVEFNTPQLITVEATPMGNLEWHVMRAMHLAGRCVNCGDCGRACPMSIPIHLLNFKTVETVKDKFDVTAGTSAELDSVMSNYKPDDKENFIKHGL
ncbi:4Fe-4S dicluster domain-containing protein [Bacteroidota bacterium]